MFEFLFRCTRGRKRLPEVEPRYLCVTHVHSREVSYVRFIDIADLEHDQIAAVKNHNGTVFHAHEWSISYPLGITLLRMPRLALPPITLLYPPTTSVPLMPIEPPPCPLEAVEVTFVDSETD